MGNIAQNVAADHADQPAQHVDALRRVDHRQEKTLRGEYLQETLFETNWPELSVNVNTPLELDLARLYHKE